MPASDRKCAAAAACIFEHERDDDGDVNADVIFNASALALSQPNASWDTWAARLDCARLCFGFIAPDLVELGNDDTNED